MTRTEPCACGGTIRADDTFPALVDSAVRTHVQTRLHVAWRARIKRSLSQPRGPIVIYEHGYRVRVA